MIVTIVIVSFNSGVNLERCLHALEAQVAPKFEVILIDNASDVAPYSEGECPHIVDFYICNNVNIGFAAACNQGSKIGSGRWIVFLNPDAFPEPTWLAALLAATHSYPKIRCFTSFMIMDENQKYIDGAGDNYFFAGYSWRGGSGHTIQDELKSGFVFSACGAGMMVDSSLFQKIGGFDEDFFCYYEDVDLGFRLLGQGQRTLFVADACLNHIGSACLGKEDPQILRWSARNRVWVIIKNVPLVLLPLVVLAHLSMTIFLLVRHSKWSSGSVFNNYLLRGLADAFFGMGKMLIKRRMIQSQRTVGWRVICSAMCWNLKSFRSRGLVIQELEEKKGN